MCLSSFWIRRHSWFIPIQDFVVTGAIYWEATDWQWGEAVSVIDHVCGGCWGLSSGDVPVWPHLDFAAFWKGCALVLRSLFHVSPVLFLECYSWGFAKTCSFNQSTFWMMPKLVFILFWFVYLFVVGFLIVWLVGFFLDWFSLSSVWNWNFWWDNFNYALQ